MAAAITQHAAHVAGVSKRARPNRLEPAENWQNSKALARHQISITATDLRVPLDHFPDFDCGPFAFRRRRQRWPSECVSKGPRTDPQAANNINNINKLGRGARSPAGSRLMMGRRVCARPLDIDLMLALVVKISLTSDKQSSQTAAPALLAAVEI
jgi:hypothetical protein